MRRRSACVVAHLQPLEGCSDKAGAAETRRRRGSRQVSTLGAGQFGKPDALLTTHVQSALAGWRDWGAPDRIAPPFGCLRAFAIGRFAMRHGAWRHCALRTRSFTAPERGLRKQGRLGGAAKTFLLRARAFARRHVKQTRRARRTSRQLRAGNRACAGAVRKPPSIGFVACARSPPPWPRTPRAAAPPMLLRQPDLDRIEARPGRRRQKSPAWFLEYDLFQEPF